MPLSETNTETVAFVLAYGPEVRAFIHSGLVANIASTNRVLLICGEDLKRVCSLPPNVTQQVVQGIPREGRVLGKLRSYALASQTRLLEENGRGRWAHYMAWSEKGRQRIEHRNESLGFLKARLIHGIGVRAESYAGRILGTDSVVRRVFRDHGVRLVVMSSYFSPRTLPFLQVAHNTNRGIVVVTNSWKDVYTATHAPHTKARIVLNSSKARQCLVEVNPHLNPKHLSVCPSLHMEGLFRGAGVSRIKFCEASRLDPDRPVICYSTASPRAVQNEENVVEWLADSIHQGRIQGSPQLLLRLNPMEENPGRYRERLKGHDFVCLQHPRWIWSRERDWCAATLQDSEDWRATIAHSSINVSIPSTVTLEFLMDRKNVVNVAFDLPDQLPNPVSAQGFWHSEFYQQLAAHPSVFPAFSGEELVECVNSAMNTGFVGTEEM